MISPHDLTRTSPCLHYPFIQSRKLGLGRKPSFFPGGTEVAGLKPPGAANPQYHTVVPATWPPCAFEV